MSLLCAACIALFAAPQPFTVAPAGLVDGQTATGAVRLEALVGGAPAARVEFVIDGWLRATDDREPYALDWDTTRELDGRHRVQLWAVARDGRVATADLTVTVSNPFAVRLAEIRDGDRLTGTVPILAVADGPQPQWVELHVDGRLVASDDSPPFAPAWDTAAEQPGGHVVSVWAFSPSGRIATASARVTVSGSRRPRAAAVVTATVKRLRDEVRSLESLMLSRRPAPREADTDLDYWRRRAATVRAAASRPPHWREFLCIHRYEGSWTANTGNGYFGGLQMNLDFQRTYGPELLARKGRAHRWTPLEQIWVAERAVPRRGFQPWPQTARMCGLL